MIGLSAMLVFFLAWSDEPKAKTNTPTANPTEDWKKLQEEIARDMREVEKKLADQDAGEPTQRLQKQVLENLDKLLDRSKNPPPPQSQPMGGSAQNDPQDGTRQQSQSGGESSRRERRAAQRRQEQQSRGPPSAQSGQQVQKGSGVGTSGDRIPPVRDMPPRTGPPDSLADVVKDIWGHLPDTLRQEVDHYYREQFMPRYRDLLQQYYLRLAETERRTRDMNP
jgi:hypothetical protein